MPIAVTFRDFRHVIDLGLEGAPAVEIQRHGLLATESIRITYTESGEPDVRLSCRDAKYWVGNFNLAPDAWPAWVAELVEKHRPMVPGDKPPTPEHAAVYLDQDDWLYADYPTSPASDGIIRLVWASEEAESRQELADQGVTLRRIGWHK